MQTQVQQPAAKRPSLMVYGVMIIIACCLPALLLVRI
jgi:hypothetical protein